MDWRTWTHSRLTSDPVLGGLIPVGFIFGPGSILGSPAQKPFLVYTFGLTQGEFFDGDRVVAYSQYMTLYAHDDFGDYTRIDQVLEAARNALSVQALNVPGAIVARWQGNGPDAADDTYGTIVRSSEYRLVGKVE